MVSNLQELGCCCRCSSACCTYWKLNYRCSRFSKRYRGRGLVVVDRLLISDCLEVVVWFVVGGQCTQGLHLLQIVLKVLARGRYGGFCGLHTIIKRGAYIAFMPLKEGTCGSCTM